MRCQGGHEATGEAAVNVTPILGGRRDDKKMMYVMSMGCALLIRLTRMASIILETVNGCQSGILSQDTIIFGT